MSRSWGVLVLAALCGASCADQRHVEGEHEGQSCDDLSWRAPTDGEVACPGASDCACGGADICCVTVDADFEILAAACSPIALCRGLAFECDGPEDCSPQEVCCAVLTSGGGSACVSPSECFGIDEMAMCHGDEHCDGLEHCVPSARDSYFDGTAAVCQL